MNEFLAKLWHYPPIPLPLHYTRTVHGKPGQGYRKIIVKALRYQPIVQHVKIVKNMSVTDFVNYFFPDDKDNEWGDIDRIYSINYFKYWQLYYPIIYRMFKIFDIKKEGE